MSWKISTPIENSNIANVSVNYLPRYGEAFYLDGAQVCHPQIRPTCAIYLQILNSFFLGLPGSTARMMAEITFAF
jgi:hypothetical protein